MPTKEKKAKKFFVPEVIQTSEMDCGPASLKALLEGFGISTSYGRLREACQTTVDGTSIDSIEDLAVKLGLIAKQIMLPYDHVLLQNYWALPSLVVTRTPGGLTHFVVAWSQHGRWIQVMDPGIGRRWVSREQFIEDMFKHTFPVLASSWRGWAGSPDFLEPLRKRMSLMCVPEELITQMETLALQDAGWRGLGTLDASVRLVDSLVQSRAVEPGSQAGALIQQLFQSYLSLTEDGSDQEQPPAPEFLIPSSYWSVTPLSSSQKTEGEWLNLYGAVMIRIHGLRKESEEGLQPGEPQTLSPELEAILAEPPRKIEKLLQEMLRQDGWLAPSILAAAFCISAAGVALQAFLLQGILSIQKIFPVLNERLYALAALFVFLIALFLIEIPLDTAVHYMGNRLEIRLRTAFLLKIPSLSDRYFHSRLTSDMTWRARGLRSLRRLPLLAVQFLTTAFRLLITAAGVVWLQPQSFGFSLAALVIFAAFGYLSHSVVQETDLRQRTHAGALSRYYLDALQGLLPLRTHGAERPFRREHEGLMVEWMRANTSSARIGLFIQGLSAILYTAFAAWVGLDYARSRAQIGGGLLLFYWVLNLPIYCQALILLFQQYPQQRNSLLSVLEPLDAREESHSSQENPPEIPSISLESAGGVRIEMQQVDIIAGGHPILEGVNLSIASGEHLAIVGPSGAGKSTLVGILLGWHTPANGTCLVDGYRLGGQALFDLRRRTVWVDP
jgi:ABC-type bacteriocin/lantibiotic exporter with double-glycine peptidase domain